MDCSTTRDLFILAPQPLPILVHGDPEWCTGPLLLWLLYLKIEIPKRILNITLVNCLRAVLSAARCLRFVFYYQSAQCILFDIECAATDRTLVTLLRRLTGDTAGQGEATERRYEQGDYEALPRK